jgi:hypothetical protein
MIEGEREHKYRKQDGATPAYKAFHEVYITKDSGSMKNEEVAAFIHDNIAQFKGKLEDKHGIPLMFFERKQDAQRFAHELSTKLKIRKEHIAIKAQKFAR